MPRPARRDCIAPDGTYHVYARGNDGMPLFQELGDFLFYRKTLCALTGPNGIAIFHYSLMPNHVHLTVRTPGAAALSRFMKNAQHRFATHFAKKSDFEGHVWQGRFKHKEIDNDAYLFACGNYIEMNAVRAGLVRDPADWPHSSYHYYAHGRPDPLITTDPLFEGLGRTPEERQTAYRRLITQTRA